MSICIEPPAFSACPQAHQTYPTALLLTASFLPSASPRVPSSIHPSHFSPLWPTAASSFPPPPLVQLFEATDPPRRDPRKPLHRALLPQRLVLEKLRAEAVALAVGERLVEDLVVEEAAVVVLEVVRRRVRADEERRVVVPGVGAEEGDPAGARDHRQREHKRGERRVAAAPGGGGGLIRDEKLVDEVHKVRAQMRHRHAPQPHP
eukprot:CAMPEP_0174904998 /NCGR_PEP_ID=MMETSP0167-20121228/51058_1 /TAXON_ID=38298 /ORGANISM="Rhodella maculata, Strain CCMP736" /LENGTH=204 /DNA_ID=CAMNT_0016147801 /DNA_START=663 /DNA_END=1274 /DNA_ORIENTATION=+